MNQSKSNLCIQSAWEVRRHFALPDTIQEKGARAISARVGDLPGVRGAEVDVPRRRLTVVYDITRQDYRHLLGALADSGLPVPGSWWSHLKTSWLQYLDENGRDNANTPAAPCCSNPTCITEPKK